jgi:EmrB/QacA subfamily drug resistance transporter
MSTDTPPAARAEYRWWILVTVALAQLMIALDTTVMNIALPSVQRDLHYTDADREWIITAYSLAFGSLLLLSGRLADRFGRRNIFVIGLIGFAIASGIGGASTSFGMLVASRAVQGAFAALLAPAALSLLGTTFPGGTGQASRDRGRAFGVFASVGIAGTAVGLLVGGAITEYLSWRWTMYINIAFAIPAIIGAILLFRLSARGDNRDRIDFAGAVLVSGGLFGVVFGVSNVPNDGWGSPVTITFLAAGAVLLIAFVVVERRVVAPLLPLRVVLDRTRGAGFIGMFLGASAMLSAVFFMAYYVQTVLGYSAVRSGVAFLPLPITLVFVAAVIGPRLNRRVGPRIVVPIGMLLGATAMLLFSQITTADDYVGHLLPGLIILGAGLGILFPTNVNSATLGVRREDAGVASALVNTVQQVGGTIAVAVFNTVATTAATNYLTSHVPSPGVIADAAVHSYSIVFTSAAVLYVVGAVLTATINRSGLPSARFATTSGAGNGESSLPVGAEPGTIVG